MMFKRTILVKAIRIPWAPRKGILTQVNSELNMYLKLTEVLEKQILLTNLLNGTRAILNLKHLVVMKALTLDLIRNDFLKK